MSTVLQIGVTVGVYEVLQSEGFHGSVIVGVDGLELFAYGAVDALDPELSGHRLK